MISQKRSQGAPLEDIETRRNEACILHDRGKGLRRQHGGETRSPLAYGGSPAEVPRAKGRTPNLTAEASLPARLCPISARVGHGLSREIDAYAKAHGVTRSRAAAEYLDIASEVLREREGIPNGRADELLEVLDRLGAAVDILGPPAFGMLRLPAHWATQGGGLKVSEDELLAEVRAVGADEWEQAISEAERMLEEVAQSARQVVDP
jgi:hypothetical protein